MDTRNKRPVRSAVSLGLGAALIVTTGVVAATPIVSALAAQGSAAKPAAAARPASASVMAQVRAAAGAVPTAVTAAQGNFTPVSCSPGCTINAMTGTVDVKDGSAAGIKTLHVWKFGDSAATAAGASSAVLQGTVGVAMSITVHNNLTVPVGLSIPQMDDVPGDLHKVTMAADGSAVVDAAAPGGNTTYTFTPTRAGTFTYQAALTGDGSRAVAMGLVGALVVRPSATVASAGIPVAQVTQYDIDEAKGQDEAVLVYTDVDSRMAGDGTNAGAPLAFSMRDYTPDYHLINGQAYPDIAAFRATPDKSFMLRVVNGSILEKSPTILGTRLLAFAMGSRPLPAPLSVSGRLVQTGDTFDATIDMPTAPTRYAIYDAPGDLRNGSETNKLATAGNAPALGGGLVTIDSGYVAGTLFGASTSSLAADVQPGGKNQPVNLTAKFTSRTTDPVVAAELYVDTLSTKFADVTLSDTTLTSLTATVPLSGTQLGGLTSGVHTFYVRAQTATGWGPWASTKVRIDNNGPAVTGLTLSSSHVNGKLASDTPDTDIAIMASLDERTTGGSNATAARFWVGSATASDPTATGFAPILPVTALTTNGPRVVASADGSLAKTVVATLDEGTYTLWVQGQDSLGQWGAAAPTTLVVDRHAPVTTALTVDPAATNGLVGSSSKPDSVRITATVDDSTFAGVPASEVTVVEGYVGTDAAPGVAPTGSANSLYFSPIGGGQWVADLPLAWLANQKDGAVRITVVGMDAAGNRGDGSGATEHQTVTLDRVGPTVAFAAAPVPGQTAPGAFQVAFTATATDAAPGTGIVYAEYFTGADPGQGLGTGAQTFAPANTGTVTVDASAGVTFNQRDVTVTSINRRTITGWVPITVRAEDAVGNWSQSTVRVVVTYQARFLNGFDAAKGAAAGQNVWNIRPSGRTTLVTAGRIAGQRSLSVATGAVGYYSENVVPLLAPGSTAATELSTSFTLAAGRAAVAPKGVTIYTATNAKGATAAVLQYAKASASGRVQFRLGAMRSNGTIAWGAWTTAKTAQSYNVRVVWTSATNGGAVLFVNSPKALTSIKVANTTVRVTSVHVGVLNKAQRATGSLVFDSVVLA